MRFGVCALPASRGSQWPERRTSLTHHPAARREQTPVPGGFRIPRICERCRSSPRSPTGRGTALRTPPVRVQLSPRARTTTTCSHALVPQQVDGPARGAGPRQGYEGSTPSERTHHQRAAVPPMYAPRRTHGPEPDPDGREDVRKTSGNRFDSGPGLQPSPSHAPHLEPAVDATTCATHLRRGQPHGDRPRPHGH